MNALEPNSLYFNQLKKLYYLYIIVHVLCLYYNLWGCGGKFMYNDQISSFEKTPIQLIENFEERSLT